MNALPDKYAFGWIELPIACRAPEFEIYPTGAFSSAVSGITNAGIASERWIYPPIEERMDDNVSGPTLRFLLPHTHYLTVAPKLDRIELSDFLILVLGFFLGLKLNPTGLGHLHRTPRQIGSLVNFSAVGRDLERAMRHAIAFFIAHEKNREIRSLTDAAFHWYLTSQSYHHSFEQFTFQYSVLDNLHRVSELLHSQYRERTARKSGSYELFLWDSTAAKL